MGGITSASSISLVLRGLEYGFTSGVVHGAVNAGDSSDVLSIISLPT